MQKEDGVTLLGFLRGNWQTAVFLASLDAIFIWICIFGLGDRNFQFIDPFFIAQLQLKIIGVVVLAWALSTLLANIVRAVAITFRPALIRKRLRRKFYRFLFAKYRSEVLLSSVLFASAMMQSFLQAVLMFFAGVLTGFIARAVSNRLGFPATSSTTERRIEAKKARSSGAQSFNEAKIKIYERTIEQSKLNMRILIKALSVFFAIGAGISHASKLKDSSLVEFALPGRAVVGAVVGQTGSGFLVWIGDCSCLSIVGFGQFETASQKPLAENEEY